MSLDSPRDTTVVADLPMPLAMDLARGAIFSRAVEVTFQPEHLGRETLTTQDRPDCRRITARRVGCRYEFRIEDTDRDVQLYRETGRVRVTRARRTLRVRHVERPTRDADARSG